MRLSAVEVAQFQRYLTAYAGDYLRNVIREPRVTCSVCCVPVNRFRRCLQCRDHHNEHGERLADFVGSLVYACDSQRSGQVMYRYKTPPRVKEYALVVASLVWVAIAQHTTCVEALAGMPVSCWATVPSLRTTSGTHPLRQIVATHPPATAETSLLPTEGVRTRRDIGGHFLACRPLAGQPHVMLIDDTWVSGGHAQSAALTLRAAGARKVSVLTVARWLTPGWGKTDEFVTGRLRGASYDPGACPWSASGCLSPATSMT
ncbi:MAG: hypothetical protein M3O28_12910 [Actinomycetota bacterium]|nr:hypothetical protein [Actinomycetota bacterium]